jgi:hypothetical protein
LSATLAECHLAINDFAYEFSEGDDISGLHLENASEEIALRVQEKKQLSYMMLISLIVGLREI